MALNRWSPDNNSVMLSNGNVNSFSTPFYRSPYLVFFLSTFPISSILALSLSLSVGFFSLILIERNFSPFCYFPVISVFDLIHESFKMSNRLLIFNFIVHSFGGLLFMRWIHHIHDWMKKKTDHNNKTFLDSFFPWWNLELVSIPNQNSFVCSWSLFFEQWTPWRTFGSNTIAVILWFLF